MTLFKSEHYSLKYSSMARDLQSCRHRAGVKRCSADGYRKNEEFSSDRLRSVNNALKEAIASLCYLMQPMRDENHVEYGCQKEEFYERGFDNPAPVSIKIIPSNTSPPKRPRSSSSSSALRCSKQLTKSRSRISYSSSRGPHLRMEDLQCIKRELKVIKNQIDGLLNSLEHMDMQNSDAAGGSLPHSPLSSSVSSMEGSSCSPLRSSRAFSERQSLKPRGTRDEETRVKMSTSYTGVPRLIYKGPMWLQVSIPKIEIRLCQQISTEVGLKKRLSGQAGNISFDNIEYIFTKKIWYDIEDIQSSHYPCAKYCRWDSWSPHGSQSAPPGPPHGPLEPLNYRVHAYLTTDKDGRCSDLITREAFPAGMYKIRFETGQYWETLGQTCFYPYVEIVFTITDQDQTFHLPLLLSRFSYSTYRGS
ncbi:hypothetical protein MHYP_G00179620 [Metynnis hypsauchen]